MSGDVLTSNPEFARAKVKIYAGVSAFAATAAVAIGGRCSAHARALRYFSIAFGLYRTVSIKLRSQ